MTTNTTTDDPQIESSQSQRPQRRSRHIVAALLVLTTVLGGFAVSNAPAQAATVGKCYYSSATCYPTMSTDWAPWNSPWSQGSQYWTVKRGTRVDMRCWTTGASRLGTSKWFYIVSQAYPYTRGYVPANAVSSQITVGRC
jgi:hypothetical protein